jgi:hypothetical protein
MCVHGFRAMASTRLNEMGGWSPDAIERQLAHQEANAVRRAYTHNAEFWSERVLMMQAWADYLDGLRQGGKVVPLIKTGWITLMLPAAPWCATTRLQSSLDDEAIKGRVAKSGTTVRQAAALMPEPIWNCAN